MLAPVLNAGNNAGHIESALQHLYVKLKSEQAYLVSSGSSSGLAILLAVSMRSIILNFFERVVS